MNTPVYLIDGSSYIYRAFYAMRELTTATGIPTNATYILTRMLFKLLKEKQPGYIAFVQDPGGPTHRHEIYPEYKATRQRMPESLQEQIPYILQIVQALGLPLIQREGLEADDIIAALAKQLKSEAQVVIVSGDKDLTQLVDERVCMWDTLKDTVYDREAVVAKFGVPPEHIADLLAIMGDSSDNIPGVPGIGPKGAVNLITSLGGLNDILAKVDQVKSEKQRKLLTENRELALISLELTRLDGHDDMGLGLADLALGKRDEDKLAELFTLLEFKALFSELGRTAAPDEKKAPAGPACKSISWAEIRTEGKAAFAYLPGAGAAVLQDGALALSWDESEALGLLAKQGPEFCLHDAKEALTKALRLGLKPQAAIFDTLLATYCIDAANGAVSLENLARQHLGQNLPSLKDLLGSGKSARSLAQISTEEKTAFLQGRAGVLLPLKAKLEEQVRQTGVERIYHEIEIPLTHVLADLEATGVLIDSKVLGGIGREIGSQTDELESNIYGHCGRIFNINSPQQLGAILFKELKLPVIKKTKTGFSTDSSVLEALADKHEVPSLILEYRMLTKLKNTYVDTLPAMVDPETGRVHTSFNQTGTATGRISSSEPNLQNIPIRTPLGRRIREAFVAPDGCVLVSADYSQIELRILAHITKDATLIESFSTELDIHARTASEVFGIPLDEVTQDMRRQAKTINFGIMYGMGAHRLSGQLGIRRDVAQHYIDTYLARYPGVQRYMEDVTATATDTGFVTTLLGRRRSIPEIGSRNFNERESGRRIAINTPIQGTAADIIKIAMVNIHERLKSMRSRMILQVHDELVFEVPHDELEALSALVKHEMETAYPMIVPVKVDVGHGPNWAEAH